MSRSHDGVDDWISFGNSGIDLTGSWTIGLWINTSSTTNNQRIMQARQSAGADYSVQLVWRLGSNVESVACSCYNDGTGKIKRMDGVSAGNWHFIAGVGSNIGTTNGVVDFVFVDGATTTNTHTGGTATGTSTDEIRVGARTDGGGDYAGLTAHAFFFNRKLTINELNQEMRFPGSVQGNRILCAPLWGNTDPEPDYSGNGNHGTVTGTIKGITEPPINGIFHPSKRRIFTFGNPRAILNVKGAQSVSLVNATSIDSSDGNAVVDTDGSITDTVNWTNPASPAPAAPSVTTTRKRRMLMGVGL